MKGSSAICVFALVLGCQAAQRRDLLSPITRVVKLLNNLSKQIEKEGKAEKDLYESFVCWGKSVISQKTDSNSAARSRADSLTTYIADLEGGKVELTSDKSDREKELTVLQQEIAAAATLRGKEAADFAAAKTEMTEAKSALQSAVDLLKEATEAMPPVKTGLVAVKSALNVGLSSMQAESASLSKAVTLGERYLSKADSLFLRRLIDGDGEQAARRRRTKKLRKKEAKKADFKMSYKARAGNIQKTLANLLAIFSKNLADAQKKEDDAIALYGKLSGAKASELSAAEEAVSTLAVESGARGVAKTDSGNEKEALEKQIIDDTRFIEQTESSLGDKKTEWDNRERLRTGELAAISNAVQIMYQDDSRDNFKKSFSSQGAFLQMASKSTEAMALFGRAATQLRRLAVQTGDKQIAHLAALAMVRSHDPSAKDQLAPVISSVDRMIQQLSADDASDLEKKEQCEKTRLEDTREALLLGKDLDDKTDNIRKLDGEINDADKSVEELEASKKQAADQLVTARALRSKENGNFLVTDKEDQDAAESVASAKRVLETYYKDSFTAPVLVQKKPAALVQKQPAVVDGEAPPPAPATWKGDYGGKQGEHSGIIGMMEMIHADILKDKAAAAAEEAQSLKDFNTFESETNAKVERLGRQIATQEGSPGEKAGTKSSLISSRISKKGEYDVVMKKISDAGPHCEYYTENYKLRVANRQIERDGLTHSRAILRGGSFK